MSSSIKSHPSFPFITIGRVLDFARSDGRPARYSSKTDIDDWTFRIPGGHVSCLCQSEHEACLLAERTLFLLTPDLAEHYLQIARRDHDMEMVARIASARGYWKGRSEERARASSQITEAIKLLHGAQDL